MNKLKGDNPVYQDFLQSGNFVFGPGDVKFADLNGDGLIDSGSGTVDDPGDRKVIGNSTPRYEYGFRLGADYKGLIFLYSSKVLANAKFGVMVFLLLPDITLRMVLCLRLLPEIIGGKTVLMLFIRVLTI